MKIYQIGSIKNSKEFLKKLGVQGGGVSIMSKKMELLYFQIKEMRTPAINILKQDALSIGAELAVPSGVITCEKEFYDCLLIGTRKQIEILSKKELAQPFGLKELAKELQKILETKEYPTKIMGVINANDDSFFDKSRFKGNDAVNKIEQMIEEGADIIDIGGVSSRPGSIYCGVEEELKRVKPIIKEIYKKNLYQKVTFSIDSFEPKVIDFALNHGFKIANDIMGLANEEVANVVGQYNAEVCIMHIKGIPENMQNNPYYENVILEVDEYFQQRIEIALKHNIENIILDIGIGFGKRLEDNLTLIKHLEHFKRFGYELLVGASRKSMIDKIIPTPVEKRLPGTLALHLESLKNGATIIRAHDVAEHKQAFEIYKALENINI